MGKRKTTPPNGIHNANVALMEKIVGYTFQDKTLIEEALTHPSSVQKTDNLFNYERLEFLGDSILGAIVAKDLYLRFPDLDEGGLTRIKVFLVAGTMLSKVAEEQGFADAIIFGESEQGTGARGMHSALENVYEAVVAALFLDGGIEVARNWVAKSLGPYVNKDVAAEPESPKSLLQEYLQARKKTPEYRIINEEGPAHDRTFYAQVYVKDQPMGKGKGRSKKEAEAKAATETLKQLGVI